MRKTGFGLLLAATLLTGTASLASAWTYDTQIIEYQGSSSIIGTNTGTTYSYRVGVITNDSTEAQDLSVELNYHDGFIGQYLYSTDGGNEWLEVAKGDEHLALTNVPANQVIWLRAVIVYYRYLSSSPWGEADDTIGDNYYFAFPPGGQYYDQGTTDVNKTGFVAVVQNGTVIYNDQLWQQIDDGVSRHYEEGDAYCQGLQLGGYTGWRLPVQSELEGLVPPLNPPFIDPVFSSQAAPYWTSTQDYSFKHRTNFGVDFSDGLTKSYGIGLVSSTGTYLYVRCVRELP